MALITSHYTLDKQTDAIRRHLADHADLLGAIRLPNTAFKANAGTEVTTDILFLVKRLPGTEPAGHSWRGLEMIDTADGPIAVNEYYVRHPEMMLGALKLQGTMYRAAEPTLDGQLTPELLRRAVQLLPKGAYIPRAEARGPPPALLDPGSFTGIKDGAYAERDGVIVIRNGNSFEPANLTASAAARVKGMMAVRDAVRLVFRTQLEDADEERILDARRRLNNVYDHFVSRYGPLSSRENLRAFSSDPDQPLLLSLEIFDTENKTRAEDSDFRAAHATASPARRSCRKRRRGPGDFSQRDRKHPLAADGKTDGPSVRVNCRANSTA